MKKKKTYVPPSMKWYPVEVRLLLEVSREHYPLEELTDFGSNGRYKYGGDDLTSPNTNGRIIYDGSDTEEDWSFNN